MSNNETIHQVLINEQILLAISGIGCLVFWTAYNIGKGARLTSPFNLMIISIFLLQITSNMNSYYFLTHTIPVDFEPPTYPIALAIYYYFLYIRSKPLIDARSRKFLIAYYFVCNSFNIANAIINGYTVSYAHLYDFDSVEYLFDFLHVSNVVAALMMALLEVYFFLVFYKYMSNSEKMIKNTPEVQIIIKYGLYSSVNAVAQCITVVCLYFYGSTDSQRMGDIFLYAIAFIFNLFPVLMKIEIDKAIEVRKVTNKSGSKPASLSVHKSEINEHTERAATVK